MCGEGGHSYSLLKFDALSGLIFSGLIIFLGGERPGRCFLDILQEQIVTSSGVVSWFLFPLQSTNQ